jgi:hypothetical protein
MKFKDLKNNTKFKFVFDQDRDWEYEKISESQVKCIKCPRTSSNINAVSDIGTCYESEVIIMNTEEIKEEFYFVGDLDKDFVVSVLNEMKFTPRNGSITSFVNDAFNYYGTRTCISPSQKTYGSRDAYQEIGMKEGGLMEYVVCDLKHTVGIKGYITVNQKCRLIYKCEGGLPSGTNGIYTHNQYIIETETGQAFASDNNIKSIKSKIMVGQHEVIVSKDGIKVGCTSIDKETVSKIIAEWYSVMGITLRV